MLRELCASLSGTLDLSECREIILGIRHVFETNAFKGYGYKGRHFSGQLFERLVGADFCFHICFPYLPWAFFCCDDGLGNGAAHDDAKGIIPAHPRVTLKREEEQMELSSKCHSSERELRCFRGAQQRLSSSH